MSQREICYLNANSTTPMKQDTINDMFEWINVGGFEKNHEERLKIDAMYLSFKNYVAEQCEFPLNGKNSYSIYFTSGATESNIHIITESITSYYSKRKTIPHIIISDSEHNSVSNTVQKYKDCGLCQVSIIDSEMGLVSEEDIRNSIKSNTCMISIITANPDSGRINNIVAIAEIAKKSRIPFHTDAAQYFGRSRFKPILLGLSAFTATFHKINGPKGVGLLVVKNSFIDGYDLSPPIEIDNPFLISGAYSSFKISMNDIGAKIKHAILVREKLISIIGPHVDIVDREYKMARLPNTILFSCDKKILKIIENAGIVIGSIVVKNNYYFRISYDYNVSDNVVGIFSDIFTLAMK